jgi:HPr kinase/phosphorylase
LPRAFHGTRRFRPDRLSGKVYPDILTITVLLNSPHLMSEPRVSSYTISIREFLLKHQEKLALRVITGEGGLERLISEPTVNRPGLALAGYFTHFAEKRLQVLGNSEQSYLASLKPEELEERFRKLCRSSMPAFIFSRSYEVPGILRDIAREHDIPLMLSPLETRHLINAITIALENDFAPTLTEYGSMVDITGIGVLIKGASGVGKSECVLGLIERGHSLVSDDITKVRNIEGLELSGTAMELGRNYMEVRGLGIIDVPAIFGIGSIRLEKRLDLIVTLRDWQEIDEIDRIGLDQDFAEILGIRVPHVIIPVRSGRDIARLVEVAALDQRLKSMGHNSALEFNEKLINYMRTKGK